MRILVRHFNYTWTEIVLTEGIYINLVKTHNFKTLNFKKSIVDMLGEERESHQIKVQLNTREGRKRGEDGKRKETKWKHATNRKQLQNSRY